MTKNMEIMADTNRFYLGESKNKFDAEITFIPIDAKTIKVDNTFVEKHLREHGIALRLVERVVLYARENNLKIVPTCSYAKRVLTSDKKYSDVL